MASHRPRLIRGFRNGDIVDDDISNENSYLGGTLSSKKNRNNDDDDVVRRSSYMRTDVFISCRNENTVMILPQVHLRKPCYDFYFL